MAKICLDCVGDYSEVLEVGDEIVERQECSNCHGRNIPFVEEPLLN